MKLQILPLSMAFAAVTLLSCNDDSDSATVSPQVESAFSEKYPSATRVSWENEGMYQVADFVYNNVENSAWFDASGIWYMTESDIPFSALPQAVQDAFGKSEYGTWTVDDVDMLERKGVEVIYVIEAEQKNKDVDLLYNAEGILIKQIADNDNHNSGNYLPEAAPSAIELFVKEKYPNARIVETEHDNGMIEVDIIHDNRGKEVHFDLQNQWLYTSWDVRVSALPSLVSAIVNTPAYLGYYIDDAEYIETQQGDYYLLELEKGNSEIMVKVDASGKVLS